MQLQSNSLSISQILDLLNTINVRILSKKIKIDYVDSISNIFSTLPNSIAFLSSMDYNKIELSKIQGLVLISKKYLDNLKTEHINFSYLEVDYPKYAFAAISNELLKFSPDEGFGIDTEEQIYFIDSSSEIREPSLIDKLVSIGKNSTINTGVRIQAYTIIGDNVSIQSNTVIGNKGFGYATRLGYPPISIPHLGGVRIGNFVEIGSSVTIDRGTFKDTIIGNFSKIDNGVHIAHNVEIGERSLVTAHVEISGSTKIGSDTWIAPNVSIVQKVNIGNNCLIGIGSVVTNNIPDNTVAYGNPARIIRTRESF